MRAIFRNTEIAQIWAIIVERTLLEREESSPCQKCEERNCTGCWDNFPINASSNCCGHGSFDEKSYTTGTGLGYYAFTPEGMVFEGRRRSLLTGSDCVQCNAKGVRLSLDHETVELEGEWELLESMTPDRGLFE